MPERSGPSFTNDRNCAVVKSGINEIVTVGNASGDGEKQISFFYRPGIKSETVDRD
jgi:hypothetical protein